MQTRIARVPGLRPWMAAIALVLLAAVAGCSALQMFYQRLDWYVSWRVAQYVDLRPAQQAQLELGFQRLWQWHRQHELPIYAGELRALAATAEAPLSPARIDEVSARSRRHWETLATRALPGFCSLLATLDEEQVGDILARIDHEIGEFSDRYVEVAQSKRRRESVRRQRKQIERWIGRLNPRQEQLLERWSRERDDLVTDWLRYRQQWRSQFGQVLALRRTAQACPMLAPLVVKPQSLLDAGLKARSDANEQRWRRLLADISAASNPQQRAHVQRRLQETISQIEQLVRRSA